MKTEIREKQKEIAIQNMKRLDIYKPYIQDFEKDGVVTYFERFAGFWAWQDEELTQKIKEVEESFGCLVYAVTHEYTAFGECYSMLIISKYKSEMKCALEDGDESNRHYAFAYVWNKSEDMFSEFGTIEVQSFGGGIRRTA